MNKMMRFMMPVKSFASMIFTGFIIMYMITGCLHAVILDEPFDYKIPFAFVLQGLVLSLLISILWSLVFNGRLINKIRYFPRLIIFSISLMVLFTIGLLVFSIIPLPSEWVTLWFVVAGCIVTGVIILSILSELYYKSTGKRYTETLNEYKANIDK